MSQAHVNPDELQSFRNTLSDYLETVQNETATLENAFANLGETWHDEKYTEFEEIFQELKGVINNFVERGEEEVPRLRQMEEDIRSFLSR